MNIKDIKWFQKIILDFSFIIFCFFQLWKISPPGQGEVRQGSRKSASGVKEKCVGVKEKCIGGQGEVLPLNVWYSAEALLIDPWHTFSLTPGALLLDPWRTSLWPLTHFSLTWRANFSNRKKATKKCETKIQNYLNIFIRFSGQKLVFNLGIPLTQGKLGDIARLE